MHYISLYIRYGFSRGIETKARVGFLKKEEIVIKNKKEVIQRSRIWDGLQCESNALKTNGAKVLGYCRNDGNVLILYAEECCPDSDIIYGEMSSRLWLCRALSKYRQRIGAKSLYSLCLPALEWGSPGSGKIQSMSLIPRCFARESYMFQYQIIVCADHCAFAWPFVHLTVFLWTNGKISKGIAYSFTNYKDYPPDYPSIVLIVVLAFLKVELVDIDLLERLNEFVWVWTI